jgi:predicted ester cyclase
VRKIRGAFSEIQLTVEDVCAADDKGVLRWSGVMKHTGDALGMPASHRTVRLRGITLVRFAGGKVVEGWDNWDQLGMLQQIGASIPAVAA